MPTLSFDASKLSRPIARVKGGRYDGEILYLNEDGHEGVVRKPEARFNASRYAPALKGLKPAERTRALIRLEEAFVKKLPTEHLIGETDTVRDLYEQIKKDATADKRIVLDDEGMFEPIPTTDPKRRDCYYIAGQSGSGKSYIAKGLAEHYHKLWPDREVYLVSKLEQDDTLDACKFIKRIKIQSFVDDYPDLEEFRNCFIIFDDYDTLSGDSGKVVAKIIDDLGIQGRHTVTQMACLSHYLTNYKATRLILSETTHIVVYPQSTAYHPLKYLLKNYVGVDEEDIKRHRKNGSRWLLYGKGHPSYMLSQKDCELLHT